MNDRSKPTEQEAAYAAAYLDAKRSPLTTQVDEDDPLTLSEQQMIDAIATEDMHELLDRGVTLTDEQQGIAKELEEKAKLRYEFFPVNPYLNPKRFPLTTQGNLGLHDQMLTDAVNLDGSREMRENGEIFTPEDEARAKELEEKATWVHDPAELAAALAESEAEDELDEPAS